MPSPNRNSHLKKNNFNSDVRMSTTGDKFFMQDKGNKIKNRHMYPGILGTEPGSAQNSIEELH